MFPPHSACSWARAARVVGLTALLLVVSSRASATPVSDVLGDAVTGSFKTYDITQIDATFTTTHITFTISLTNAPVAPSVNQQMGLSGFVDIDVDQISVTGASSNISTLSFPFGSSGLGIEYYLDLFSENANAGFVNVRDPLMAIVVGTAPITYGASSAAIVVPLSLLGNDDGLVNYAVVVGDFGAQTDQAVDAGIIQAGGAPASSSFAATPEPPGLALLAYALWVLALWRRPARGAGSLRGLPVAR